MQKLVRIQKRFNLNEVYVVGDEHPINKGNHTYHIARQIPYNEMTQLEPILDIKFQDGPRNEPDSTTGVLDTDLLEIVRHRLQKFQSGPFATRENAIALTHIEEALMWMNKRVEDRAEIGTLGTNKI